jgi:hypothetical protein
MLLQPCWLPGGQHPSDPTPAAVSKQQETLRLGYDSWGVLRRKVCTLSL